MPVEYAHRICAGMICSVVEKEHGILLPSWFVKVNSLDKVQEKSGNHVAIGGGMAETEPYLAICVKGCDH